jgi:hypothetical protein
LLAGDLLRRQDVFSSTLDRAISERLLSAIVRHFAMRDLRPRLSAAGLTLVLVLALASGVTAVEAVSTPVDVRLTFTMNCEGTGLLKIFDPGAREFASTPDADLVAAYRKRLQFHPGSRIHVTGAFNGAAHPRLELLDANGATLLSVDLVPFGGRKGGPQEDLYLVSCGPNGLPDTANTHSARVDLSLVGNLILVISFAALLIRLVPKRRFRRVSRAQP